MLNRYFNRNVLKVLETVSFPMYHVKIYKNLTCTCNDGASKEGYKLCKKCLGTGHKIKIKKVMGYIHPDDLTIRLDRMPNTSAATAMFFKPDVKITEGDIIVYNDCIDIIQTIRFYYSDSNKAVYQKCDAAPKKQYCEEFLTNFHNLIGR